MQYRWILADESVNLHLCNMFVRHLELLKERNVEKEKFCNQMAGEYIGNWDERGGGKRKLSILCPNPRPC